MEELETRHACLTVDAMCRRVTSYSLAQSEPSKVTMVLCSSTECLYASRRRIFQVSALTVDGRFPPWNQGSIPEGEPEKQLPRPSKAAAAQITHSQNERGVSGEK
ncbi:hypothetical protein AVEN_273000-1 [Araneus ventricosus]|uniref:Uncharacterized protein n=1 Tax=Araneus ventricosus TaxID=182803 RepID=A0A4Y2EW59_ARAVE|nr:hypothetical protein AVEN_273000-1 [Araneus ventricosus]